MKDLIDLLKQSVNKDRAFANVSEIAQHHRIQASPGYRAAAEFCVASLRANAVSANIVSYPAQTSRRYLSVKAFQEWHVREAWCRMLSPEQKTLADFHSAPLSLIQRSQGCDFRQNPLDIVYMDKGCEEAAYADWDLEGKLLFVRERVQSYLPWAIGKHKAVGFITDFMRDAKGSVPVEGLSKELSYTSFWWRDAVDEHKTFGFVLSPEAGEHLAHLCTSMQREHAEDVSKAAYPQVSCYIDADLYDGTLDIVEAFIPGETEEEILLLSHLCHPKTSANDNASGVACAMEAMKTLQHLLSAGKLVKPKRGIRLCLVPEFFGSFAYLSDKKDTWKSIKAGLNLDMVGGMQTEGYGPLILSDLPAAAASFVSDAAAILLDELKHETYNHVEYNPIPLFNACVSGFAPGSDHVVFSDPLVGIPTPMLGQWPDAFYHSSGDTIDRIDANMLQRSTVLAASYAYMLANFSLQNVQVVLYKGRLRFMEQLLALVNTADGDSRVGLADSVSFLLETRCRANADMLRFFLNDEDLNAVQQILLKEKQKLNELVAQVLKDQVPAKTSIEQTDILERRLDASIVYLEDFTNGLQENIEAIKIFTKEWRSKNPSAGLVELFVQFAIDGKRSLDEVIRFVNLEAREDYRDFILAYIEILKLLQLVTVF